MSHFSATGFLPADDAMNATLPLAVEGALVFKDPPAHFARHSIVSQSGRKSNSSLREMSQLE